MVQHVELLVELLDLMLRLHYGLRF
jgi:hypothetical protein